MKRSSSKLLALAGARQRRRRSKDGAKYYTPDHYDSFKFIVEGK